MVFPPLLVFQINDPLFRDLHHKASAILAKVLQAMVLGTTMVSEEEDVVKGEDLVSGMWSTKATWLLHAVTVMTRIFSLLSIIL